MFAIMKVLMKKLPKQLPKRLIAVNILGVAGYLLTLTAWVLFLTVALLLVADTSVITVPTEAPQAAESPLTADASGAARVASYALAVIVTLVTVGILATLPYFVGKYLSRGLRRMLRILKVTPTPRSLFVAKIIALMIPAVGFFTLNMALQPVSMTFAAISIAAFFATILAVTFFLLQLFVARYLRVRGASIW